MILSNESFIYLFRYICLDMFKGYLKITILNELQNGEKTGYDIIKIIQERTKVLRPSPGCVYPSLKELLENGLVKIREKNSKKYYFLSEQGKRKIKELNTERKKIFQTVLSKLKAARISKDLRKFDDLELSQENLKIIRPLMDDIITLRNNLIRYLRVEKRNELKIKEMKNILREANNKIIKLVARAKKQK